MNNRTPRLAKTPEASLSVCDLQRYAEGWLLSGEIDQHSSRTLASRRSIIDNRPFSDGVVAAGIPAALTFQLFCGIQAAE